MTPPPMTCAEVRQRERRAIEELGLPSLLLMENAGRGLAELLLALGIDGKVVVCCGKGNNGGDGLVLARHLDNRSMRCSVLLFARPEELTPDSSLNYRVLTGSGVPVAVHAGLPLDTERVSAELTSAGWVVDALFGTGLRGPLRPPFDEIVKLINDSGAKVLAVDIPSGLDGDTGLPLGPAVRARHTGTLIACKIGFLHPAARAWTGEVHLIDTGMPRCLLAAP